MVNLVRKFRAATDFCPRLGKQSRYFTGVSIFAFRVEGCRVTNHFETYSFDYLHREQHKVSMDD